MLNLLKSFLYAFNGVRYCVRNERNMRIHIAAAVYVLLFSLFYDMSVAEYALLLLTIALVMAAEMINTALEALVDLTSPEHNRLAGAAKDVAAGAVLVCAAFSVAVGIFLMFDVGVFKKILNYYLGNILSLTALAASIFVAVLFIANPKRMFFKPDKVKKEL